MRTRLLIAILALALLPIAGCGGNGQADEYVEDFNEIQESFEEGVDGFELAGQNPEEIADSLEGMAAEADRAADEMRELDPPEEVAEQNSEMVALLEEIRDVSREALEILSGDVDTRAAEALEELSEHIVAAGERADALTEEIAEELGKEVED